MSTLATLIVRLVTDVSDFQAGMNASVKSVKKVGTEFTQVGHDLEKMGSFLTGAITLPIVAAGAAILKFATDSSKSFDTYKEHLAAATANTEEIASVIKDASRSEADLVQTGEREKADVLEASGRAQVDAVANYENKIETVIRDAQQAQQDLYENSEKSKYDITKDAGRARADLERRVSKEIADAKEISDPKQRAERLKQIAEDQAYDLQSIQIDTNRKMDDLAENSKFDLQKIKEKEAQDLKAAEDKKAADLKAIAEKQSEDLKAIAEKQAVDLQAIEEKKAQALEDIAQKQADAMKKVQDEYNALSPGVVRMGQAYDKLKSMLTPVQTKFQEMAATLLESVIPIVEKLMPYILKFVDDLEKMVDWYSKLDVGTRSAILGFVVFLATLGPAVLIIGKLSMAIGAFLKFFAFVGPTILKVLPAISQIVPWITSFVDLIGEAGLGGALSAAFPGLAAFGAGIVAIGLPVIALSAAILALILTIYLLGPEAWNTITMIAAIWQAMCKKMWTAIGDVITQITHLNWGAIGQSIGNALQNAWQAVANWVTNFYKAGQAMIVGFINGIVSYATVLVQTVMNVVQSVINEVKKLLGIASPSKIMEGLGKNMMLGLEVGVTKNSDHPISAASEATGSMIDAAKAFRSGRSGGRNISVGPITINGDLSAGQKASLAAWFKEMAEETLVEALGEPA
jgi:hypothetical protein